MSNIDPELIVRINELAKKKKDGTISEAELEEQKELRQKYLKAFRSGFKQQLIYTILCIIRISFYVQKRRIRN